MGTSMGGDTGRERIRADLICLFLTTSSSNQTNTFQYAAIPYKM